MKVQVHQMSYSSFFGFHHVEVNVNVGDTGMHVNFDSAARFFIDVPTTR